MYSLIMDFYHRHQPPDDNQLTLKMIRRDINSVDAALFDAASWGLTSIVRSLIDQKADINFSLEENNKKNKTVLQHACQNGHEEIARILLNHGAEPNPEKNSFSTLLHEAATNGHERIVSLLIENSAHVNAKRHFSALALPSIKGLSYIVRLLLDNGADVNLDEGFLGHPLQAAATFGREEIVRIFLEAGADVNSVAPNSVFGTPLHSACRAGHEGIVHLLLKWKADPNIRGGEHDTPLKAAFEEGYEDLYLTLVNAGAEYPTGLERSNEIEALVKQCRSGEHTADGLGPILNKVELN